MRAYIFIFIFIFIFLFLFFAAGIGTTNTLAQQGKKTDPEIAIGQALNKFPGFDTAQMQQLTVAKKTYCIPLPTWLPDGFKVEKVIAKIGKNVAPENKDLRIIYSKKLPNGKIQLFSMEAGIDGIGDLLYESTHVVKSSFDHIGLCYEPKDETREKTIKKYVRTQWFDCGGTAWAYSSVFETKDKNRVIISLADTKKILASLKRL